MEFLHHFIDFFLHLDRHLDAIIRSYGVWTYLILFLIIFAETGLVFTPILPGDSLLFATGSIAAMGSLDVVIVMALLSVAAVLGDTVNYSAGHYIGPRVFQNPQSRIFKKKYLDRTEEFYRRYGGKTIIFARFVPIVRTFAPFVAGVGSMRYGRFLAYNIAGGVLWIAAFVMAGYWFGSIPAVKGNFTIVILAIIFLSILPGVVEFIRAKRGR